MNFENTNILHAFIVPMHNFDFTMADFDYRMSNALNFRGLALGRLFSFRSRVCFTYVHLTLNMQPIRKRGTSLGYHSFLDS